MFRSFPTAWAMLFCFFLRWWPTLCTWLSCQARVLLTGEAGSWARLSRHRSPWLLLLSQVSFRLLRGPGICMRTELGVCRLSMGHLFDRAIYLHPNPTASLKAQQFSTDLKKMASTKCLGGKLQTLEIQILWSLWSKMGQGTLWHCCWHPSRWFWRSCALKLLHPMHGTVPLGSWISYDQLHLTKDSQDIPKTIQHQNSNWCNCFASYFFLILFAFCRNNPVRERMSKVYCIATNWFCWVIWALEDYTDWCKKTVDAHEQVDAWTRAKMSHHLFWVCGFRLDLSSCQDPFLPNRPWP